MPAVAKEFTANGAANFVAHYVKVLDYASKTGDVTELERLSDPGCGGCSDYIETFRSLYENGGRAIGRDWSVSGAEVKFYNDKSVESVVTTSLKISAGEIRDSAGKDPTRYPATTDLVSLALLSNGTWRVTQFGIGAPE